MNKKKLINYVLAFICPFVLLLIVFGLLKIYPFGNNDLLWFDTQAQYIDFLSYWQDVIRGQASIFYSFSKNLGGNMFGLFTYYLTSPINLIVLLFSKIDLPQAFMLIILIKIGLCGVSFRHYLDKSNFVKHDGKHSEIKNLIFSTLYALMAYNIVFCMSHMWLDCVALLPLILLGIEKIIYEHKWGLYLVTFTISILANYYIAFMIAIFTIFYYIYILFCNNKDKRLLDIIKENKGNFWLYVRMSLIAVLISGIIIIPTIYSLASSKGQLYNSDSLNMYMYFDYFTLFAKNTLGAFSMNELRTGAPNIYCGIITFILTILYFFNNKIEKREKIYTGFFIFIFFICFYFNTINLGLHMMQSPMSFPFRYSFIFSFLSLILAYKCINNMDGINNKLLIYITIALVFIFMLVDHNGYEYLANWKVFITLIFLVIYSVYISKIHTLGKMGHISLYLLLCTELVISCYFLMAWMPYGDRNIYRNQIERYTPVYEYIKGIDKGLYRISYDNRKSLDDAMMYNFKGLEHYSSVGEKSTENFLSYIGYSGSPLVEYGEGTLLDNSLLGVKYVLSTRNKDFYMNLKTINDVLIYENPYALPFGFIVNEKVLDYSSKNSYNIPFEYQNYIFGLITGKTDEYYTPALYEIGEYSNINIREYEDSIEFDLIDESSAGYVEFHINTLNKPIYSYLLPEVRSGMVSFLVNGNDIATGTSNITYIGCSEEEIILKIMIFNSGVNIDRNFLYYLDNELVIDELTNLQDKSLDVIEHKDNYIKASINAKKDELLLTTIPYDLGWKVYINGTQVETKKVFDTLMAISISSGENIIEFKYVSPGFIKGLTLTIIGLILLAVEMVLVILNKKGFFENINNDDSESEDKKQVTKEKNKKNVKSKR